MLNRIRRANLRLSKKYYCDYYQCLICSWYICLGSEISVLVNWESSDFEKGGVVYIQDSILEELSHLFQENGKYMYM